MYLEDLLNRLIISGKEEKEVVAKKAAAAAIIMASMRWHDENKTESTPNDQSGRIPTKYVLEKIREFPLAGMKADTKQIIIEFRNMHYRGLYDIRFNIRGEYIYLSNIFRTEIEKFL